MQLGGKPAMQVVSEVAEHGAAVIAMGSCASWGGVPSADPNPTGAVGVSSIISRKAVVNLPGCPPNPYNLLAVVLEYVTMGKLPALDEFGRPQVRLRPRDPRKLPAPRALRCRTLCRLFRR